MNETVSLTAAAEQKFDEGKDANKHSDDYILGTVFFASVLFFAGITTKFRGDAMRSVGVLVAFLSLVGGVVWLSTLPRLDFWF